MPTEMGEYLVGAYLKVVKECDFIDYNVRRPGGGLQGLNELDVVGFDFKNKIAYLCEVTTHIRGILYKDNATTVQRIAKKIQVHKDFADKYLSDFPERHLMFWSPYVPKGFVTEGLSNIDSLELVINETYTKLVNELRENAKKMTHDVGNPFFRALQILEHLR